MSPGSRAGVDLSADALLAAMNDAVLVTGAELDEPGPTIRYCNAAFTEMTGWLPADVLGRSPRMLQAPGIDRAELARVRRALEQQRPVRFEVLNLRKDGTTLWVEIDVTPLRNGDGQVDAYLSVQRQVSARRARQDALHDQLVRDDRTGLLNRRGLVRELEALVEETADPGPAVLLADLLGLRQATTALGREAGDALVETTAQRLVHAVGGDGVVGRVESGEFVLLLRSATLPAVVSLCERVRRGALPPVPVRGGSVAGPLAIGIALAGPGATTHSLLSEADVALRAATTRGPGAYEVYDLAMGDRVRRRLRLDAELHQAVAETALTLHYQPVVHLRDGRPHHAEALLRWLRDGEVVAGPAEFVQLAEESGLILPLGRWALQQACADAAAWQDRSPGLGVAVNLSPLQLRDPELLDCVDEALDGGLPADLLTLEVTESAVMHDPVSAVAALDRLRRRGLHLALDDFGTGHSSLAQLSLLPLDSVKVDKDFVQGLDSDAGRRAVVKAVVALARDLGLEVVAEGVETAAHRQAVLDLGCDLGQGWLFGRPAPVAGG